MCKLIANRSETNAVRRDVDALSQAGTAMLQPLVRCGRSVAGLGFMQCT